MTAPTSTASRVVGFKSLPRITPPRWQFRASCSRSKAYRLSFLTQGVWPGMSEESSPLADPTYALASDVPEREVALTFVVAAARCAAWSSMPGNMHYRARKSNQDRWMSSEVSTELVGGPGFEPGASPSRTLRTSCPPVSRRFLPCPPVRDPVRLRVPWCPSVPFWFRKGVTQL